ncbi:TPA: phage DNA ejection protein [Yersinia enterocolitica]|nr:phage DNA ejection protein [Yersinia enterocolitica]HDL7834224.1 phage DNA ejection protein [Yersinia enterocolitica]HDL7875076.1 phage DNA ejection protein [Yersinia enterocolitica]HDL7887654.1 phage DNA ejection protein [Yersinia enterocolitica]HDL7896255.1 phage DNA ejection protein [Yersinia enterocolitica]
MATWEQGNAGGLLAGIGGNNANAPQSGDVNATLSLIRDNNDRQRSGANNVGLQALQGISSVTQMYKQNQQQEQQKEFQKAYGSAYASGDRNAMRQLAAQYPTQMESVQKGMGFIDDDQRATVGSLAASARLAASNPETFTKWLKNNATDLDRAGIDPQHVAQIYQQDPKGFGEFADHLGMSALGPEKYFDLQDKAAGRQIDRDKLAETERSNRAGEGLQARGQNITLRGQDISAQNSQRSAGGSVPSSVREYEYVKNLSPDERKEFLKLTKGGKSSDLQSAQLSSGETVMIDPTPLGAGSTKFYKGYDADGKVITVPVSSLSTSIDSSGSATQGQMNSDIDLILKSNPRETGPLTGITGSTGRPAITADVGSRISDPKTREIFNAANRIQGNMQNQGVAAARSMGASGINTVAEAKMYFQSMPQIDYSSRNSLIKSMENVKKYTDEHNSVNKVNYSNQQQPAPQQPASGGGFSNLWGG